MQGESDLVLWGAALFDGVHARLVPEAVITIRSGRVLEVRQGAPEDPDRAIDLRGRFVLPGLIDAHAHAEEEWVFAALLAAGVTVIRNPATRRDPGRERSQTVLVRCAGPIVDGPASRIEGAVRVGSESEMRAEVRRQAELGADYIKLYEGVPPDLLRAGIGEAHAQGLQVIGDLVETSWTEAARAGIDFLCHAMPRHPALLAPDLRPEYLRALRDHSPHAWIRWLELVDPDGPQIAEMAETLADHGVAVDPTLASIESMLFCGDPSFHASVEQGAWLLPRGLRGSLQAPALSSADVDALRRRARPVWGKVLGLVARLRDAGVRLLAGSDAPRPWVVPGASLHRELALLVSAGLTPAEALRAATGGAAAALGLADTVGTVAPNRRADLVVVRADPLSAIANTTSVELVVHGGRIGSPEELRALYD